MGHNLKRIEKKSVISRLIGRAFVVTTLLCTIISCASNAPQEQLDVPVNVFSKESRFAILWIKPCNGKTLGGCEVDDGRTTEAKLAIHGSPTRIDVKQQYEDEVGFSASIARVNAIQTIEQLYLRDFKNSLAAKGLDIVALANPIYEGALQKHATERISFADEPRLSATQFPLQVKSNTFDFAPLYNNLAVDYLLVLELLNFSVDRHYGPTGAPIANPQAVSAVRVYLHKGETNEVLFNDFSYKFSLSDDGWDNPPLYQSLADLLLQTLENAITEAKANLMEVNF